MVRKTAQVIAAMVMAGQALAAEAQALPAKRIQLEVAPSPRPGILEGCELYFFAQTANSAWKQSTQGVDLRWQGGRVHLLGILESHESRKVPLAGQCFRLVIDGEILTGGAVIDAGQKRALPFPVIVIQEQEDERGKVTGKLQPRWPTQLNQERPWKAIEKLNAIVDQGAR